MALRRKITDNNIIKNYKTSHYKSFNFDNIIIPSDKTYTNEANTSTNILNAKNITIIGQNMKIPLYNNPLFSPKQLSERTNSEINFSKKDNLNRTFEPNTLYLSNKNQDIYKKKNNLTSSINGSYSKTEQNDNFKNKNKPQNIKMAKNQKKLVENKNHNIININLYNEKNNFIENNIINRIYMNKNKNIKKDNELDVEKNILSDRRHIPRRNNYTFYYSTTNAFKFKTTKINNLPKVKKIANKNYNIDSIVKIQAVFRGYILNKKLDTYLRNYSSINKGVKIIQKIIYKRLFVLIKKFNKVKKYYYNRDTNSPKNQIENKNIELQSKIDELINEKRELQNNYKSLKEFMQKYQELLKINQKMKSQIDILTQKNQNLTGGGGHFDQKFCFQIQNQNNFNIIRNKDDTYQSIKFNDNSNNINEFLTLGKDGNEKSEGDNEKGELKINKLKILIKNKENRMKIKLMKNFTKFLIKGIIFEKINSKSNETYIKKRNDNHNCTYFNKLKGNNGISHGNTYNNVSNYGNLKNKKI